MNADEIRFIDDALLERWFEHEEHLKALLLSPSFQVYQGILKDCMENILKFGLDINSQDRSKDYDEINRKRGAASTYEEIIDLPAAILAQINQVKEANDVERDENETAEAEGEKE